MDVTGSTIDLLFKGFNASFDKHHAATPTHWKKVATHAAGMGSEEVCGWLKALPQMREWLGDRVVKRVLASDYVIRNRKFEATVQAMRDNI